jgi:hypothetical protein
VKYVTVEAAKNMIRELAVAKKYTKIIRGVSFYLKEKLPICEKVVAGTLTLDEFFKIITNPRAKNSKYVGIWWFIFGNDKDYGAGVEDARDYAKKEDDLTQGFGKYLLEEMREGGGKGRHGETTINVEFPVVFIAERPEGWDPAKNPLEAGGLMGNSYISKRKWPSVKLIEVQYLSNQGWVSIPAKGRTVFL